jgi:hypothetical protein
MFQKLDPFLFSLGGGRSTLLGPLEKANLNHLSLDRLALSKEPNRVGVPSPLSEDGNKSSFWYIVFSSFL